MVVAARRVPFMIMIRYEMRTPKYVDMLQRHASGAFQIFRLDSMIKKELDSFRVAFLAWEAVDINYVLNQ